MKDSPSSIQLPPAWDDRYPDREVLRREVQAMREAFLTALFDAVPRSEIAGLYAKGSSLKPWDSPLDYVPELSDVDLHILFADEDGARRYIGTVEQALAVQAHTESLYRAAVPNPVHVPRIQLILANPLFQQPDFVPSPDHVVSVILGRPYPVWQPDPPALRRVDAQKLLDQEEYLAKVPFQLVDKGNRELWSVLRGMIWRVSPTGSRVLSVRGVPYEEAWGTNRTAIVTRLATLGEEALAQQIATFYLQAWAYFLSGHSDADAARAAILAGTRTLARGIEIARAGEELLTRVEPS